MNFKEYYPYVLAIRQSPRVLTNTSLQDFLHSEAFYPINFHADGEYSLGSGKKSGAYQLCQASELEELAQKYAWPILSDCPFVGAILGYCLFHPWDNTTFLYIIEAILNAGHGFLARLDNGVYFDIVAQKTCTLRAVVGRHGFKEGRLILTQTNDYHEYIRNSIRKSLEPLGLKPYSYHAGDHEHILDGFEGDEEHRVKNWALFERHADKITLKLWVSDWDAYKRAKPKFF